MVRGVVDRVAVGDGYVAVRRRSSEAAHGRVLIVPPFGVPASALGFVAEAIATRGFEALTLDPRHHVGAGSGDIATFTVSGLVEDCAAVIERHQPDCVVGVSLGARAVTRALADLGSSARSVLLIPVVDVHATLAAVFGRDWFAVADERLPAMMPVLGHEVGSHRFRDDCRGHDLMTLESTARDLARLPGPITLLPGVDDPWVSFDDVAGVVVAASDSRIRMRPVDCHRHDIHQDPELALSLIDVVVHEVTSTGLAS